MASTHRFSQFEFEHYKGFPLDLPRQTPANTSFLFVVKTPDSDILSRSTSRSAAASINSHAQRWAQDVGGSKGALPLHTNKPAPSVNADLRFKNCVNRCRIDRLGVSDTKTTKSKSRRSVTASQSKSSKKRVPKVHSQSPITRSSNNNTTETTSHQDQRPSKHELNPTLPTPSSPLAVFSGSTASILDYVRIPCISLDPNIQSVLQYYLSFVLLSTPTPTPGDGPQSEPQRDTRLIQHSSTIRAIVQGCLQETVHLYALLAATASRMKRVSGIHFAPDHGPESYLSKAIQGLRALLTVQMASSDRQLILDIYYLSVCEWYLGSYDAAYTHSNFLKRLLKALPPGMSEFDQYVYDMLSYDSSWFSPAGLGLPSGSDRRPKGPKTSSFVPYQLLPQDRQIWDLESLEPDAPCRCSALRSALQGPSYSQDLRDKVQGLAPILTLFRHFNPPRLDEEDHASAAANQLVSSCSDLAERLLEKPSYGNELCCRLALILNLRYIARIVAAVPPSPSGPAETEREAVLSTQRLRRQLQYEILLPSNEISRSTSTTTGLSRQLSSRGPPSPMTTSLSLRSKIWTGDSDELLLWILVTGVLTARRVHLSDEVHWFGTRATALMGLLDITTHAQLQELMLSFFAVDGMVRIEDDEDLLPLA
ncbi:uncharacterized protein A1O9_08954 [Exophiala aquamarina CBS 119918]|uniref:Uncharacterized protein n=1 Tax=Exophiala aquamarina CBS 119918 TaxID=1182545 RepID=A0A072PII4_9EURO|nr:uncharacterized protein A1O9_08954 [Exophiala aquamarina CBS 119918]KEF55300.1 hypothetical protein A1O9_08954 [Exophiala aquamarina CBS 119918]